MPTQSLHPGFIIGVIIIVINYPLGWIGLASFFHLAHRTGIKKYYLYAALVYAASWAMLFIGIYLCGKDYADGLYNKYHTYFIVAIAAFLAAIIIANLFFYKKRLKNQSKKLIDKKR